MAEAKLFINYKNLDVDSKSFCLWVYLESINDTDTYNCNKLKDKYIYLRPKPYEKRVYALEFPDKTWI